MKKKTYTCMAVSTNANAFGYKKSLWACKDGTGFSALTQAYGIATLPKVGDEVEIVDGRYPLHLGYPETLPRVGVKLTRAAIDDAKAQGEIVATGMKIEVENNKDKPMYVTLLADKNESPGPSIWAMKYWKVIAHGFDRVTLVRRNA